MRPTELLRSSTFRLALLYMVLFAGSVLLLLGFIYWSTVAFMSEQVDTTIETEIVGLAEQYRQRGLNGLVQTINDRIARNPGSSSIYLFASPAFRPLAGNLTRWPSAAPSDDGWVNFLVDDPASGLDDLSARARVFVLQGNFKLLVGRDVREFQDMQGLIERALLWGLALTVALALVVGLMMSRTTLGRLEEINLTSREIMAGDLARRVPTRGSNDDFDQLADNLNAMLDEIGRLMEGIRHVSDNIAHDLRTPLTRLRQRLEGLAATTASSDEHRAMIERSISDADQLLETFSALLRIARIEAGGFRRDFEPVNLATLASDSMEFYDALAEEEGLTLSLDTTADLVVDADRDLVFQAVSNLVDNAIKYAPKGTRIVLGVRAENGEAVLSVADSGPGIPATEHDNVMRRFYRIEGSRSTPGSGLGLSLVKAVASIHGAKLALHDNAPGLRAELRFPLPSDHEDARRTDGHGELAAT
jgi:signal transduction histidine kinase